MPLIVKAPKATNRVAVLIPDHTWYAYDFFDDNRDGFPDSWYYRQGNDVVSLARPFAHSGMPWQFNSQLWPFLRWLRLHKAPADFLSESDAVALGNELVQDYDLIVVPTHLEYVTDGGVRRAAALPRRRRRPDLPRVERHLLEGRDRRDVDAPRREVARLRPPGGGARRRAVLGLEDERRRAVHRREHERRRVGIRGHGPRARRAIQQRR